MMTLTMSWLLPDVSGSTPLKLTWRTGGGAGWSTQRPPLTGDVGCYAVGVPAAGDPVAGITGGGGGGVIGAQVLAGGGPAGIWVPPPGARSTPGVTPPP